MDYIEKYHINDLTPVDCIHGMYFKRDDLYKPFSDLPLSGGKVRQCISLIGNNQEYIQKECDGHVVTGTGMTSPQGIIVTKVAKAFGFRTTIFVGHTNPNGIRKNNLMMNILTQGGQINYESVQAYESCLNAVIRRKQEAGEKSFHIKFGINLEKDPESILGSVGNQVQNIPKDLDYLIIPCGSCIMLSGILQGLEKYQIYPKKVIGIQIAGYDRTKTIEKILGESHLPYELRLSKDYPYSRHLGIKVSDGSTNIRLDPIYEAKAYDYVLRWMSDEVRGKKVLFWVVGDSNAMRDSIYNSDGKIIQL